MTLIPRRHLETGDNTVAVIISALANSNLELRTGQLLHRPRHDDDPSDTTGLTMLRRLPVGQRPLYHAADTERITHRA